MTRPPSKADVPRKKWLSNKFWSRVVKAIPIACVDVIFQRRDRSILFGWRLISPYNDVWALPGGRLLYGENLLQCASRIAQEYGLEYGELHLNGVFPVRFPKRSDIAICLAALSVSGDPRVDGVEFSKFAWSKKPPKRLGLNYLHMVKHWQRASDSKDFLHLTRLL